MNAPTALHIAAVAALLIGAASAALARKIAATPLAFPVSGVEAVVEPGETFAVPVGAPAVYAWLDVGQLVQGRGTIPAARQVWAGGAGAPNVRFRSGGRIIAVPGPQLAQFKGYAYENRHANSFAELGLQRLGAPPGPRGVYANQVALRPGDVVTLVETEPVEIWRGGLAQGRSAAAAVAAQDRRLALILYVFAALCAVIAVAVAIARWKLTRSTAG